MSWNLTLTPQQKAAYDEIMGRVPELMYQRQLMPRVYLNPTGVVLPARPNEPYEGLDATDRPATMFGLPITWSEREEWGLVLHLVEGRKGRELADAYRNV